VSFPLQRKVGCFCGCLDENGFRSWKNAIEGRPANFRHFVINDMDAGVGIQIPNPDDLVRTDAEQSVTFHLKDNTEDGSVVTSEFGHGLEISWER